MTPREYLKGYGLYTASLEHVARAQNLPMDYGRFSTAHAVMAGERLGVLLMAEQRHAARWRTAAIVAGVVAVVGWVRSFIPPGSPG